MIFMGTEMIRIVCFKCFSIIMFSILTSSCRMRKGCLEAAENFPEVM